MTNENISNLKDFISRCIYDADRTISKIRLQKISKDLFGFSSERVRHLLNNLCKLKGTTYLELGVYRGSTMVAAVWENEIKAYGVENFKHNPYESTVYNEEGWFNIEQALHHNLDIFQLKDKVTILKTDIEDLDIKDIKTPVNVCYYDAGIKVGLSTFTINKIIDTFDQYCILICSNLLDNEVPTGISKALEENNAIIHHEVTLKSRGKGDDTSWWCGLRIWLVEKKVKQTQKEAVEKINALTKSRVFNDAKEAVEKTEEHRQLNKKLEEVRKNEKISN